MLKTRFLKKPAVLMGAMILLSPTHVATAGQDQYEPLIEARQRVISSTAPEEMGRQPAQEAVAPSLRPRVVYIDTTTTSTQMAFCFLGTIVMLFLLRLTVLSGGTRS